MKRSKNVFAWLLLVLLTESSLVGKETSDTLTLLHISDTHISFTANYHPLLDSIRAPKNCDPALLDRFLREMPKKVNADLVVLTGDMVDFYEAETRDQNDTFLATQIEQFAALVHAAPVPLLMVLGNHDISSYWIREQERSLAAFQLQAQAARAAWIRNLPCFRAGLYYHRTFQVAGTRYHFLFLDNGYALNNGAFLDKAQLDWLDHELSQTGKEPVIFFMHRYLPSLDYNQDRSAFAPAAASVLNDSTCATGFLRLCNEHPNIQLFLVGHGHNRKSENIPFPNGHKILQLITGGFINNTNNWRIITCTEEGLHISAPGTDAVEWRISND